MRKPPHSTFRRLCCRRRWWLLHAPRRAVSKTGCSSDEGHSNEAFGATQWSLACSQSPANTSPTALLRPTDARADYPLRPWPGHHGFASSFRPDCGGACTHTSTQQTRGHRAAWARAEWISPTRFGSRQGSKTSSGASTSASLIQELKLTCPDSWRQAASNELSRWLSFGH